MTQTTQNHVSRQNNSAPAGSVQAPRPTGRKPLATLGKIVLATLVGIAIALTYLQAVVLGVVIPPLALFVVLSLISVGLVATGWRWAPLLATIVSILVFIPSAPHFWEVLQHPVNLHAFSVTILIIALLLIGTITGLGATFQNYRSVERRTPRWLWTGLVGLAGLSLGAILVAAIPQSDSGGTGLSAQALAGLPTMTAQHTMFHTTELRVRAGETIALRLTNLDNQGHNFSIDELNVHVAMPAGKSSLALFKAPTPGTYTYYCNVSGHRAAGMVGKLIVTP